MADNPKAWKQIDLNDKKITKTNQFSHALRDGILNINGIGLNTFTPYNLAPKTKELESLVDSYREIAAYPTVDSAIDDIVNEMVSFDENEDPIDLDLSDVEVTDAIKEKVHDAWVKITNILDLNVTIHQRAKQFYIDGRLAYQKIINVERPKAGLHDIIELDVKYVNKIREIERNEDGTIKDTTEYVLVQEPIKNDSNVITDKKTYKLDPASVSYVTSGIVDRETGLPLSNLNKAIKPVNNLAMMENAVIIYRITRAPERRIFYVDVAGMPTHKAESHLRHLRNEFRNRMLFDPSTGKTKDIKSQQAMQEDLWLPRTSGGRGTEVSTLAGGQNLGDIEDVEYFRRELYRQLNVPQSRYTNDSGIQLGRAAEISRDELKFSKFVSSIRKLFNKMFIDLLKTELVLTGVMSSDDWDNLFNNKVRFIYTQDVYIEEQKNCELLRERLELLGMAQPYIGKYISNETARRDILQQTDEDLEVEDDLIEKEKSIEQYQEPIEVPPQTNTLDGINTFNDEQ